MLTTEYFDEYRQSLRPGMRSEHQHNRATVVFRIFGILEQLEPQKWRAEVRLFNEVIIEIDEGYPSKHAAGVAAERALTERLVAVFRAP